MIKKVTDPKRIVTDELVLRQLARQGIDKDYVEFWHDYAPRSKGKEYSPYAKFYRDLKSGKKLMAVSGLPKVKPDGTNIDVGWLKQGNKYVSKANLFSATVEGKQVQVTCLSDQPNGAKKGDSVTWKPQLFIDGIEIVNGPKPTLLPTDPVNAGYQENTLEWAYGNVCKRRLRIIEGRIREKWIFGSHPHSRVSIKHNFNGELKVKLGIAEDAMGINLKVNVIGDEEVVEASEFDAAVFPVEIGASPETFYPDEGIASVDGYIQRFATVGQGWLDILDGAGTDAFDSGSRIRTIWRDHNILNRWTYSGRGIMLFYTAALPNDATVTDVVLSMHGSAKSDPYSDVPTVNIYSADPANDTILVPADYGALGTEALSSVIAYGDWSLDGYNHFNLIDVNNDDFETNADGTYINKTGLSKFGFRNANYDVARAVPTWDGAASWTYIYGHSTEQGTDLQPRLVVTYTRGLENKSANMGAKMMAAGLI